MNTEEYFAMLRQMAAHAATQPGSDNRPIARSVPPQNDVDDDQPDSPVDDARR